MGNLRERIILYTYQVKNLNSNKLEHFNKNNCIEVNYNNSSDKIIYVYACDSDLIRSFIDRYDDIKAFTLENYYGDKHNMYNLVSFSLNV